MGYDLKWIADVASQVGEAIEAASWETASWKEVPRSIAHAFPGSLAGVFNQDVLSDKVSFNEVENIDPLAVRLFREHYAYIDPSTDVWSKRPSGTVMIATRDFPPSGFVNTEFYRDFMPILGDGRAWTGVRIDVSPEELIFCKLHYSEKLSEKYDEPAYRLFTALRGPLEHAIHVSKKLRDLGGEIASASSLIKRNEGPAFVVDDKMRLLDANTPATNCFTDGSFLCCRQGRVVFANAQLSEKMADTVANLAASAASPAHEVGWRQGEQRWIISLTRLPRRAVESLLIQKPRILVTMRELTPRRIEAHIDLDNFSTLFDLTPTEKRLCISMARGDDLADAAATIGISYEHARQRIKAIFQKTNTTSQSELCVLLARCTG